MIISSSAQPAGAGPNGTAFFPNPGNMASKDPGDGGFGACGRACAKSAVLKYRIVERDFILKDN